MKFELVRTEYNIKLWRKIRRFFEGAMSPVPGGKGLQNLKNGPEVLIIGHASGSKSSYR